MGSNDLGDQPDQVARAPNTHLATHQDPPSRSKARKQRRKDKKPAPKLTGGLNINLANLNNVNRGNKPPAEPAEPPPVPAPAEEIEIEVSDDDEIDAELETERLMIEKLKIENRRKEQKRRERKGRKAVKTKPKPETPPSSSSSSSSASEDEQERERQETAPTKPGSSKKLQVLATGKESAIPAQNSSRRDEFARRIQLGASGLQSLPVQQSYGYSPYYGYGSVYPLYAPTYHPGATWGVGQVAAPTTMRSVEVVETETTTTTISEKRAVRDVEEGKDEDGEEGHVVVKSVKKGRKE